MSLARLLAIGVVLLVAMAACGGSAETLPSGETETAEAPAASQPSTAATPHAPSFQLQDGEYVTMDQVKRAMDDGADFILLDSRVPEAYAESHIPGAISIPFYEVDELYEELPKDTWIVAYCSCPTAEAEAAVEVLRTKGYAKTAVLLEGYPAWVEAGYPTTAGPGA